jgi:hypothetical protein
MAIQHQNSVFIDPEECDSSVGYHLELSDYENKGKTVHSIHGTVVLTDCSHKIAWDFGNEDHVAKIDAAICMLQEFRKKYVDIKKMADKLSK